MSAIFAPVIDVEVSHRAHLAALRGAPEAPPAYARTDARLRKASKRAPFDDGEDQDWFEIRWAGGEADACRGHAERVASAANRFVTPLLRRGEVRCEVTVAAALRPEALATVAGDGGLVRVRTGPGTSGSNVLLACIGALIEPTLELPALDASDRRLLLRHTAGAALVSSEPSPPYLDELLAEAAGDLPAPAQHGGLEGPIRRLADAGLLDQAPGEVERMIVGLGRRYPDRLHRAWLKGFFVPRGFDLREWVRGRLAAV